MSIQGSSTILLISLLLVALADNALGQCTTPPPTGSHSSPEKQTRTNCKAPESLKCQADSSSTMQSSTSTQSSTSAATDSSSASSSIDYLLSTTAGVAGSVATVPPASNEPCPCAFMTEMNNIKVLYLNVSQQVTFEVCLVQIRIVLVDVTLTIYEKVSKVGYLLKDLFNKNKDIKKVLKCKKIGNLFRFFQFISSGVEFDYAKMDGLITPVDSSGASNLTNAIRNGTANDKCGAGSSIKINAILGKVDKVFKKQISGYKNNKGRKLGHCKRAFEGNLFFFTPSIEICVRSVEIKGFGSFDQFLQMAGMFDVIASMGSTVVNGTGSQCVLIQKLQEHLNSPSTINSTSPAILTEAQSYVQDLIIYFGQTTNVNLRLKFIVSQASTKSEGCRTVLYAAQITVTIDFADIHSGAIFSINNAVNTTAGPPSELNPETCMIDPVYNTTDMEESFAEFFNQLDGMTQSTIKTYKNAITNCVRTLTPGDYLAKFNCAMNQIRGIANNANPNWDSMQSLLLAVEFAGILIESAGSVVFATFRILCGCGN